MTARIIPHRFTVPEYERMVDVGILNEDDRVELIRGEIVAKTTIGTPHIACVNRLNRLLVRGAGDRAIVSVQNPVQLGDSEPEPDIALLAPRDDFYGSNKAGGMDVLLVIEVADASLEYDRDVKRPLYAEAGIAEYWIVNLLDGCLEVYRQPRPDGTYADAKTVLMGNTIEVVALPGLTVAVADII